AARAADGNLRPLGRRGCQFTEEQRERLRAAVQRLWQDHGGDIARNMPWSAEEMAALHAYLDRARAALDGPSA
ncbi:hypothetical protein ABT338_26420, partial [Streptosporangium saharense]